MPERALIYDERDYRHKTVVLFEAHGQGNEFGQYLIRTLISEGRIEHRTVEKVGGQLVGRLIVKPGPTNFITATTSSELHAENETRVWTLLVDDSPETTREVLALKGQEAAGNRKGLLQTARVHVRVQTCGEASSWRQARKGFTR
jgi:hypothetical protein